MTLVSKHSTWAEGGQKFAERLEKLPGVAKVVTGNLRSSHVSPRKRPPAVKRLTTSVRVTYYGGGALQNFHLYPNEGLSLRGLARQTKKALKEPKRQNNGESPKEDIKITPQTRRKTAAMEEATQTRTREEMKGTEEIILNQEQADAYNFLLSLMPKDADICTVSLVSGKLMQRFGERGRMLYAQLKFRGVIIPGEEIGGNPRRKQFTVARKSFRITETRPQTATKTPTFKTEAETSTATSDEINASVGAIIENVKRLKKLGFDVEITNDKIQLHKEIPIK